MTDTPHSPDPEKLFALFRAIDEAFRDGEMDALRAALGNPADFPNTRLPPELELGEVILHHAIYFSPIAFIAALIGNGASVRYVNSENIPPLFAAILSERDERGDIMRLLLDNGADILQQGYNDWTALHLAVNARDVEAIEILVAHGADPHWRASEEAADTSAFDDVLAMEFDEGVEAMLNAPSGPRD